MTNKTRPNVFTMPEKSIENIINVRKSWPDIFRESVSAKHICRYFLENGISSVLDIGCGYGKDTNYFTSQGLRVTGIDLSSRIIRQATALWGTTKPSFIIGDMRKLPFADCSFDAVYGNMSYHLLPDKESRDDAAKEMHRVLRPEGIVFQVLFSSNDLRNVPDSEQNTHTLVNGEKTLINYLDEEEVRSSFASFNIESLAEVQGTIGVWNPREIRTWYLAARKPVNGHKF
ncbi:class I SAM-dependent methyltransferase [Thermoproteota archaeon]